MGNLITYFELIRKKKTQKNQKRKGREREDRGEEKGKVEERAERGREKKKWKCN